MLHLLHSLTMYPLELVYKYLYILAHALVGDYGLALLCLSLFSFILLTPLRQRVARHAQARIVASHKQDLGHPVLSWHLTLGLLLPLPFLCAAYFMLSDFQPIEGQSFVCIPDLAKPDGLLWGFNALPLLMSLFSLGAIFTSPGANRPDQRQQFIVAGLYLVALYAAPAALLLYWTGNQAIIFLTNVWLILRRRFSFFSPQSSATKLAPPFSLAAPSWKQFGRYVLIITAIMLCVQVLVLASIIGSIIRDMLTLAAPTLVLKMIRYPPEIISWLIILLLGLLAAFRTLRAKYSLAETLARLLVVGASLTWVVFVFFRFIKCQDITQIEIKQQHFALALFCSFPVLLLLLAPRESIKNALHLLATGNNKIIFFSAVVFTGLIITVLSPSSLYLGAPEDFDAPFLKILVELLPYLLAWLLFCAAIWGIAPAKARPFLVFAFLIITFIVNFNSSIYHGNYGIFDHGRISHPDKLNKPWLPIRDVLVAWFGVVVIFAIYYFRQTQKLTLFLQTVSVLILLSGALAVWSGRDNQAMALEEQQAEAMSQQIFQLSPDQPNVLIFILDSFTGGHLKEIMEEYPHLKQRYNGFIWYPDTVAMGEFTALSIAGLYGGPNFSPARLNQQADVLVRQKFLEAFFRLPHIFSTKGFDVRLLSLPFLFTNEDIAPFIEKYLPEKDPAQAMATLDGVTRFAMMRWVQQHGMEDLLSYRADIFSYILGVSLFKASPHALKKHIYTGFIDENLFNPAQVLAQVAAIGMLPQVTTITSSRPTLKIFYSFLPHYPWHLPQDSLRPVADPYPPTKGQTIFVDGVNLEHMYAEKHTLDLIADYVDFLKGKDCLNNTLIVLVSDHCDGDSRMLNEALGVDERGKQSYWREKNAYMGRPHALLMVKPLHSREPFRTSKELMHIADVPAIACQSLGGCSEYPYPITDASRIREHYFNGPTSQFADLKATKFIYHGKAVIKGSMFSLDNWTIEGDAGPSWRPRD